MRFGGLFGCVLGGAAWAVTSCAEPLETLVGFPFLVIDCRLS